MLVRFIVLGTVLTGVWFYLAHLPVPDALGGGTKTQLTGVFHIHTDASHDGRQSRADVVQAAKDNRLDFVVITDHNANSPEASVEDGITVLAYPEVSTLFGHVIQLGSRIPIERASRNDTAITEKMRAQGALPIIAHPARWRRPWEGPWNHLGGIEIANTASTLWQGGETLLTAWLLAGPNPQLAQATLYSRNQRALSRWEEQTDPRVGGYCSIDSHGQLPSRHELSYWKLQLDVPSTTPLMERTSAILSALSEARFHCVAGALQGDSNFAIEARTQKGVTAGINGATLKRSEISSIFVRAPHGAHSVTLYRNGHPVFQTTQATIDYRMPVAGNYRAEATQRIASPWLLDRTVTIAYSNKIRVTERTAP